MRRIAAKFAASLLLGSALIHPADAQAAPKPSSSQLPANDAAIDARVEALLAKMTAEEKAGQLSQFFYFAQIPAMAKGVDDQIAAGKAGSILFTTDPKLLNRAQKMAVEQTRLKIPLLVGFDVIHGLHTIFPVPLAMAASWDPKLVERSQAVAAQEARAVGIHWTFAPNVDVALDARWGRIVEGAGEDPYLGSAMAAAQVRGFQGSYIGAPSHIIAGPKHFAGYGAAMGGRDYDQSEISENQLHNFYLPPFKAAIDAGAGNIMAAYMALNGVPAAGNHRLLTDTLRTEWGFRGWVVSDAGGVDALRTHGIAKDGTEAAVKAISAGTNMEMVPPGQKAHMPSLAAAITEGKLTTAELDAMVRPVLAAKFRMGLFENPYVDEARAAKVLADPAHADAARAAAERSAVLLRNEGGLLPLDRKKVRSLAVIGPLADSQRDMLGPWIFSMNNPSAESLLAGIRAKVGQGVTVSYSEGVRIPARVNPSPFDMMDGKRTKPEPIDEDAEIAKSVALARQSDAAILVLGEAQNMSGEKASRASFDLPGRQKELLDAVVATGKPVIVVLMSARPLAVQDSKAAAILDIWYPGSQGAAAAANLLFGDAVPGGKLPISWVRSAAQAPMTYARLPSHDPTDAAKRYQEGSNEPAWPFGFGLSYTSFAYSNLKVLTPKVAPGSPVNITVDVANSGPRSGDEVAQLYIHQKHGTSSRPVRQLKGFERVTLKPGEKRTLTFTLSPEDLRYWSDATRSWIEDSSDFEVWVGGDSTASLGGSFEVGGR
ncbi:beta-glucosidase [Novosphingobium sp. PhB57]|uniref:glycoside hydrolase family 3 N-terminal domain-containing protein n=1 Tax=Novosphingobium sp. PhB57 TaxID=2485107 RepID=UPI00104407B5|nr:glycoside hydrolase family 3 N-terminal domain-containing protein [Novosphingobium sp. PhB57]TCU58491.1 beta-glucosidase [Novosphingobium sp. PhB57]